MRNNTSAHPILGNLTKKRNAINKLNTLSHNYKDQIRHTPEGSEVRYTLLDQGHMAKLPLHLNIKGYKAHAQPISTLIYPL